MRRYNSPSGVRLHKKKLLHFIILKVFFILGWFLYFYGLVSQGGWGWLVVGAAFLVQVLTTGLQLAFGVMAAQIARHFSRQDSTAASSLHMEAGQSNIKKHVCFWANQPRQVLPLLWKFLIAAREEKNKTKLRFQSPTVLIGFFFSNFLLYFNGARSKREKKKSGAGVINAQRAVI